MMLPGLVKKSAISLSFLSRVSFASVSGPPDGTQHRQRSPQATFLKKTSRSSASATLREQLLQPAPAAGAGAFVRSVVSSLRGGEDGAPSRPVVPTYETLDQPAAGSPFHYAFPVHDLDAAKKFYGQVLGCAEGRSSTKWQDFSLHGHQIVCHWVGNDYKCMDYYNPVDGDEVPVPHAGLALTVEQFHALAERVTNAGIEFIIPPHLRFEGMPGEQYTMFFKDPSGNNLEFKAMTRPENLFAKYNVADN